MFCLLQISLLYIFELSIIGCNKSQMILLIHYNSLGDARLYCIVCDVMVGK